MSTLPWCVLIVMMWCVALLDGPQFQLKPFSQSALPELDASHAIAVADRNVSLQTSDRRRGDLNGDGDPPAAPSLPTSIFPPIGTVLTTVSFSHLPATRSERSPAQPRAPPKSSSR